MFAPQCSSSMPMYFQMGILVYTLLDFLHLKLNILFLNRGLEDIQIIQINFYSPQILYTLKLIK